MSIGTVHWEEEERERKVLRLCSRCQGNRFFYVLDSLRDVDVVSPQGTGHLGSEWGATLCGVDATGPDWWWRT